MQSFPPRDDAGNPVIIVTSWSSAPADQQRPYEVQPSPAA
jgi:hypothetical protein